MKQAYADLKNGLQQGGNASAKAAEIIRRVMQVPTGKASGKQ
jgi:hypothetical protein